MNKSCRLPDCVIPAAGLSSRMGQWKMMLPFPWPDNHMASGGPVYTLLDVALAQALSACPRVVLVTGRGHQILARRYGNIARLTLVYHPQYQQGMTGSVQAGLAYLSQLAQQHSQPMGACLIAHGDMPLVGQRIYRQFNAAMLAIKQGAEVVFPGRSQLTANPGRPSDTPLRNNIAGAHPIPDNGDMPYTTGYTTDNATAHVAGHPVLLSPVACQAVINAAPGHRIKPLLAPLRTHWLQLNDDGLYFDVDTPAAYRLLRQYLLRQPQCAWEALSAVQQQLSGLQHESAAMEKGLRD